MIAVHPPIHARYDVIVVGARVAGASVARLLARHGRRVLVVDKGRHGTDTLSTHALMRGGVLQLARWGLLPRIVAAGTPAVKRATFLYGTERLAVDVKPRDGVDALYAPRRTVLDRVLVDAAVEAGVQVSYGVWVHELTRRPDGRVGGLRLRGHDGWEQSVDADLVIGADGVYSTVARLVGAEVTHRDEAAAANVFGYWSNLPVDGYRWYYQPGSSVGAIPTNDGLTCLFASVPARRFDDCFTGDVAGGYRRVLDDAGADLVDLLRDARPASPLRGFAGVPAFFRRGTGPGWALVGDAAYFKDPITAHGITDALIDAEHLARAVVAGTDGALADYDATRRGRCATLFEVTQRLASFEWTLDEARLLHKQLAAAMGDEVKAIHEWSAEEATV